MKITLPPCAATRIVASVSLSLMLFGNANAARFTVTNTSDGASGSLRNAVASAAAGDTIVFALPAPSTINLSGGQIVLDKNLTITGPGADRLTLKGVAGSRIFRVSASVVANLSGFTITGGSLPPYPGGGIYCDRSTLYLTACVVKGNQAASGSGLSLFESTTYVMDCTFSDNIASAAGGAVKCDGGVLYLTRCALYSNRAATGGAIGNSFGTVALTDSTLALNTAASGGAVFNDAASFDCRQTTIVGNSASVQGGGIRDVNGTGTELANVIIAQNVAPTQPDLGADALSGEVLLGGCIIGKGTGAAFIIQGRNLIGTSTAPIDPKLTPLRDNGGPTLSCALLPGSPAFNAGDSALAINGVTRIPLVTEQRGFARISGGAVDAGACEAFAPRYYVLEALRLVPTVSTGDATADQFFQTARTFILQSLDLSYWVNDFTLRGTGAPAFATQAQAATSLGKIVAANLVPAPTARLVADAMAEADRRIANDAINVAATFPGVNAALLNQARTALAQAESFRSLRKMPEAISTYGVAWKNALLARGVAVP